MAQHSKITTLATSAVAIGAITSVAVSTGAAIVWALLVAVAGACVGAVCKFRRSAARETQLGQYTLGEKIGEGGMGVVYKANHALLRRPAAIKLLAPECAGEQALTRFEREVQLTSQLTHPNTISVYDFGRTANGTFYYAMEYVDGLDLQTLVEREGPQDPARVAHLLAQLAGALAEAHGVGLIHRDVKPANVMVCERGGQQDVVKVLDFGLIKEVGARGGLNQTDVHHIIGTPLYLSPEAITSPESVDARSDLYALGAVGYFLLTGAPPFSGENVIEVCGHHLHTVPARPSARLGSNVPEKLEALIMSCLAKAPGQRPASAAQLQKALLEVAADWTEERAAAWWAGRDVHSTQDAAASETGTIEDSFEEALAA
jgi:eukaryotic-like serine/threonine-protein kinase